MKSNKQLHFFIALVILLLISVLIRVNLKYSIRTPLFIFLPVIISFFSLFLSIQLFFLFSKKFKLFLSFLFINIASLLFNFVATFIIYFSKEGISHPVLIAFLVVSLIFYTNISGIPIFFLIRLLMQKKNFFKLNLTKKIFYLLLTALVITSCYSFFIEPYNIETTYHKVNLFQRYNLKIVHISDIQTDDITIRENQLVQKINQINPDLILISGDYYNGSKKYYSEAYESAKFVMSNLKARYGVYGVSSDVTPENEHFELFNTAECTFLDNSSKKIKINEKEIFIVGISRPQPDLKKAFKDVPIDSDIIIIYHGPELFFNSDIYHYKPDLLLVGHTHGGQIAMPIIGPLTSGTIYGRKYAKGWFENQGLRMYVNRGVGLEGWFAPKVRFLSRPEIAVIEI